MSSATIPMNFEDPQPMLSHGQNFYYAAIRAVRLLPRLPCITRRTRRGEEIKASDLIAVIKIEVPTAAIEDGVHVNRALLLSTPS